MNAFRGSTRVQILRAVLLADAAFEFVVAVLLFAATNRVANWLDLERSVVLTVAVVFLVAGVALLALAWRPERQHVWSLAVVNVAFGLAGWLWLVIDWDRFSTDGRYVLGAVCDAAILIGLAEWFAVRQFDRTDATEHPGAR